jgi:hypothetical protein
MHVQLLQQAAAAVAAAAAAAAAATMTALRAAPTCMMTWAGGVASLQVGKQPQLQMPPAVTCCGALVEHWGSPP